MLEPLSDLDSASFLGALERGEIRAARPAPDGGWLVDENVKQRILQLFRLSKTVAQAWGPFQFRDREQLFPRDSLPRDVRVVPGGTTIRRGAFLAPGVVVMPPSYVNVGAYVDEGSMVDSHVLVGSCAQIGRQVHLSAGVQIGGVLEPIGALPVIVEDGSFIGGMCGIFEGVRIGAGAVLAAGVTLTASKPVFDLVHGRRMEPTSGVLLIPERAVVVSGSRRLEHPYGAQHGLAAEVNLIVKYRDPSTDARTALEDALR